MDQPIRVQIERRAYAMYLERGAQDGQSLDDWLAAEHELTVIAQESIPVRVKLKQEAFA